MGTTGTFFVIAAALAIGGLLILRIGRKPIILGGCVIAAITYVPIYQAMVSYANLTYDAAGKITGAKPDIMMESFLVFIQVVYVTMVYGPIAAFLVEYFPAKIRYTSLSIPYHLGNGEFGGWLPFFYTGIVAATVTTDKYIPWLGIFDFRWMNPANDPNGNIYGGLIYVIVVSLMTAVIGWFFIPETKDRKIWDEFHELAPLPGQGDTVRATA